MNSAPPTRVADLTRTHYVQLDGLRGLAILLVMVYHFCLDHAGFETQHTGIILQLAQGGWMGVDLFFVLSGFLITGILIQTRSSERYLRNFLARRFLRIWPLYYLNLVFLLVVLPLVLHPVPASLTSMRNHQGWFWLYSANWLFAAQGGFTGTSGGYFWSLAVEEQFYLVWPLVVYMLSERALVRTSLGLLLLSVGSRIVLAHSGVNINALYVMTFTHLDGLAVGSTLAVWLRSAEVTTRVVRIAPLVLIAALLGVIGVRISDGNLFYWSRSMATYGYAPIALLFGALLVCVLTNRAGLRLGGLFSSRFMTKTGKYSYALYMIHIPIANVLFAAVPPRLERLVPALGYEGAYLACFALAFAVSWGLALASWHLLEKRILALKRYFTYLEPAPAPARALDSRTVGQAPG